MSDRPLGVLLAIVMVAPICLLCIGGPALVAMLAGTVVAWFTGAKAVLWVGALLALALLAWRFWDRRRPREEDRTTVLTRRT
jgi:predicted MFS family arabinose efflux permease